MLLTLLSDTVKQIALSFTVVSGSIEPRKTSAAAKIAAKPAAKALVAA
jgi:hypothetical protein